MEWDQIADSWAKMAARLRNDRPNIDQTLGTTRANYGADRSLMTPPKVERADMPASASSTGTGRDRGLTANR